jgi:hypothetical protein
VIGSPAISHHLVAPAKAGAQRPPVPLISMQINNHGERWVPAFAGTTESRVSLRRGSHA